MIEKLKVDVLYPERSLYEVLHHFTSKFFEALQRAGCSCRLLKDNDRFYVSLHSPPDLTIAFNGALRSQNGGPFCDQIKVPHIACLVDPPFRFLNMLPSDYLLFTSDDAEFCDTFRTKLFPRTYFMPHGVEKELAPDHSLDRDYDVAMLSTYIDCEKLKTNWKEMFSKDVCKRMELAAKITLQEDAISFVSALKQTLEPYIEGDPDLFQFRLDPAEVQEIFTQVELYIKGQDRLDLLKAVSGSEVHVFGSGIQGGSWEQVTKQYPHIISHPAVTFSEAQEVMKRTKILLNSSLKNKHGAHERIFTGAAVGCAIVTNDNAYMRKHFTNGKDCLLYRRSAFDALNESIASLLANESDRQQMAEFSRTNVVAHHTWDHRVKELFKEITPVIRHLA